jgi:GNAT superfamily N-acetyltransferase
MKDTYFTKPPFCIGYTMSGDEICLVTGIRTYPIQRGKGLARQVLRMILEDADQENVTLMLAAQAETFDNPKRPGLTQTQLVAWYKRHGFEEFVEDDPTMLRRYPKEIKLPREKPL